ncbi:MAG: hypothetical protein JSV84_09340 [Gemmatimonadota bacterium]|nr:MAG: hypothetical protein JSV84_09340 [Gemmatimonadota bacterium]
MVHRYYGRTFVLSVLVVCLLLAHGRSISGEITTSISFSPSDLSVTENGEYDVLSMTDCDISREVGEPQIPVTLLHVVLPAGADVNRVEVLSTQSEALEGIFRLYPVQPPQPYGAPGKPTIEIEFFRPKADVYGSTELYPTEIVEAGKAGSRAGYRLAGLLVYPIQYIPAEGKLLFHRRIDVRIHYSSNQVERRSFKKPAARSHAVLRRSVERAVLNPEDVSDRSGLRGDVFSAVPPGSYEYVIVTDEDYAADFQPLADWKTKKGVPANTVTTDWIYATYPGVDHQEQIRNFIRDAYENWGTLWVLLGGDCSDLTYGPSPPQAHVVPARIVWAMDCEFDPENHPDENDIRADLYYSDLDGTWDDNGNGIYGEVADNVDLYPDVYVGRASVNTTEEVNTFVNKILTYEKPTVTDRFKKLLFLGEIMWTDPYTDGGEGKNMIDDECIPPRFDPITKLYQSEGNENTESVMAAVNEGHHFINHDGHCMWYIMGMGNGSFYAQHMDALTNDPAYSIIYSIGCWPAAFDYDCVAEHFITNPHGGGVAFVGNSRYGWGSPGNPGYGYSDRIDHRFLYNIYMDDIYHIGEAIDLAKAYYVPYSQMANVYRIHQYQVNLLGDPEMPIWTDDPAELTVIHPSSVVVGSNRVIVTVTDGTEPVGDALVCLHKGSDVYTFGRTDAQGQVSLDITPSSNGTMDITVTGHNVLPFEGTITVTGSGAQLSHVGCDLSDDGGNGDGLMNPGETVSLGVAFANQGNETAYGVTVTMSSDDDLVTVLDGDKTCGDVASGEEIPAHLDDFSFMISSEATNGHVLYVTFTLTDQSSNVWTSTLGLPVCTPVLSYVAHEIDDAGGNGNGFAEPGETVDMVVTFSNTGLGNAVGVTATIATSTPHVTIAGNPLNVGNIGPDEENQGTFSVTIDHSCPAIYFPILTFTLSTQDGYTFESGCLVSIGPMGFGDNMESGQGEWTNEGEGNMWHLSDYRSHSGNWSWYCGDEQTHQYDFGWDCPLVTPAFGLSPHSTLSFWVWFEVATYGVFGITVEVKSGLGWKKIDFIGSGGALGPSGETEVRCDWMKYEYDLSSIPVGEAQLRFRFFSIPDSYWDGEYIWEGVYLDDVTITPSGQADLESMQPDIRYASFSIEDSEGNGDGLVDPGEQCQLLVTLHNQGLRDASNVVLYLSTDDPDANITDGEAFIENIYIGDTIENVANPFSLQTGPEVSLHVIPFTLSIFEGDAYYSTVVQFHVRMGQGKVLIVEDDNGSALSSYYEDALQAVFVQYDMWDTEEDDLIPTHVLEEYDDVLWVTGPTQETLSEDEQQNLRTFLDNGGNLLLSGNMIGYALRNTPFFSNYLHADYVNFMTRLHHLNAVPGNPILQDMDITIAASGQTGQGFTGEIDPLPPAFSFYTYDRTTEEGLGDIRSSGSGAVAFGNGTYKVVYFSFGIEGIEPPETRTAVLDAILNWFRTTIEVGNGDVNLDGNVNIIDVVWAVNIVLGTHQPTEQERKNADLNGDGQVNVIDVIGIVNLILHGGAAAK